MLKLSKSNEMLDILSNISKGIVSPRDFLFDITEEQLIEILSSNFCDIDEKNLIGTGSSILPGDVTGQLVLDRKLGEYLLKEAKQRNTTIDLIYSCPNGNLEDFHILTSSKGFFTNQQGRTTFCPVQASCEGIPTLVGVECDYQIADDSLELVYICNDDSQIIVEQPSRFVVFEKGILQESDNVSLSSNKGLIFKGKLPVELSDISKVYLYLSEIYLESFETYGPLHTKENIIHTNSYKQYKEELVRNIQSPEFHGFQKLIKAAREISDLKVYSTAHTSKAMVLTKLFSSHISIQDGEVELVDDANKYGLGLLRDERMWNKQDDIDLLRLMFLGKEVLDDKYLDYKKYYIERFADMIYDVFKVGTGNLAVVRLLCMPYNMIFPKGFQVEDFAIKYKLDINRVKQRVALLANESETYHGCRGIRVTVQREDICEAWCEGVIKAAKKAESHGIPIQLQVLLSMVTFPQEVELFLKTFKKYVRKHDARNITRGISVMIETSASFHAIEDILNIEDDIQVNGVLFGGNDFTAACLNMNRSDSAMSMIPEYVKLNVIPSNPFQVLNEQVVGKVIIQALRRTKLLKKYNNREYIMGLGGEIAGSWDSVKWLSKYATPHGLNYISTPPDRILFSLIASAQATLRSLYSDIL
ncbi:putative PEP-binding protein [Bacillus sp. S10(2024)]|uniref:putative PEP-binding protein n=1 Tax=Bacillus sp. S10(2024) TaxID=3162886 RepID=UPI003D244E31